MYSRRLAADGDHLRPLFGEPGPPRHWQHEAGTIQDRVSEGHDAALDGRSFLGEPPQMHCEGHVVAEDEIAGLRIGEAHLSQVSSDEGPNIGAGREHRGIRALGRQGTRSTVGERL